MKNLMFMGIVLLAFIAPALHAQEAREEDRAQLLAMLDRVEAAINEQDVDKIASVLHPDVTVVFLNGEVARGVPAVRDYFQRFLGSDKPILSDYSTTATLGAPAKFVGNVAMADGTADDRFVLATGNEFTLKSWWTVTLVKEADQWQVRQLHFSNNTFDNALLGAAKQSVYYIGGVAALIALLLGVLVGRLWRRR